MCLPIIAPGQPGVKQGEQTLGGSPGKLKFDPRYVNALRDHGTSDGQFVFLLGDMKFKLLVRLH